MGIKNTYIKISQPATQGFSISLATFRASRYLGRLLALLWSAFVVVALIWGWANRGESYVNAEYGLGYFLGIVGGSMMLLLLTYSMRKRIRTLGRFFTVRFWFRLHMFLGICGPLLILYHSNFGLGSLNSNVALFCMLLVSGSGLIGRYLYSGIHHGLYGEKINLKNLRNDFLLLRDQLLELAGTGRAAEEVETLFAEAETLINTYLSGKGMLRTGKARRRIKKINARMSHLVREFEERNKAVDKGSVHKDENQVELTHELGIVSRQLLKALGKLPRLSLYERLFSLWHVIHLPIFGLMILTAVTHVVAVHMY